MISIDKIENIKLMRFSSCLNPIESDAIAGAEIVRCKMFILFSI